MSAEPVLDTGVLVSLLDRSQRDHLACRRAFEDLDRPLASTEAVLTESCHLLARVPHGAERCLEFVLQAGIAVAPATPESLRRSLTLMRKYADVPMDYADATLVVLAEDLRSDLVFSLDHRGFGTYRASARRAFRILP